MPIRQQVTNLLVMMILTSNGTVLCGQIFGTDFAYIQTGIYDYMNSGTTLAISKKGSGLAEALNPCIKAFIETESYKDLCTKYSLEADCFPNKFFDTTSDEEVKDYNKPSNELTTSCSDGYCPCS